MAVSAAVAPLTFFASILLLFAWLLCRAEEDPMPFPGYPNETHYSPNFSRAEMRCHCGCETPPAVDANLAVTAEHLEELRIRAGGYPLIVDDAYRCLDHNKAVGGVPNSEHPKGKAADVRSAQHSPAQLAFLAAEVAAYNNGGIGTYSTFVHCDWRGYQARWDG